ncbi:MAG: hypothetical protein CVV11_00785 [Gammaproteobacteria bacterium HGW-Gammaproteobacteria-15]|nr:MAG: hypothetical protein CVV11_00785 [Gammaproteobacteria bacterium HGW-Gammaproteobacteria-15]
MNDLFNDPSLPYLFYAGSMLIGGFICCNKWIYSGKSFYGILGIALIFGAIFVASLAPVGGAA